MISLLKAKSAAYDRARTIFHAQVLFTVVVPAALLMISLSSAGVFPWAALYGLTAVALNAAVFDTWIERLNRLGASFQESFDTQLLSIPWNEEHCGSKPLPNDVVLWAERYTRGTELENWYAADVGRLPLRLATIVCQRDNGWWDARVRERFAFFIRAVAGLLLFILVVISLAKGSSVTTLVEWCAAALPIIEWVIRSSRSQTDVAKERRHVSDRAANLWKTAVSGEASDSEVQRRIRSLQDQIYSQRVRAMPIFGWAYAISRDEDEKCMRVNASQLVAEFKSFQRS